MSDITTKPSSTGSADTLAAAPSADSRGRNVVADGVIEKVARAGVIRAISTVVGMEVTEVNVTVSDVHIPSDDADEPESRVQ
ncbi:hypothetical protein [Herbiconiux oxytropis]|uniref:hypothetical protein n=1 Tax=Herbiconiux oxytropis TaxID=2970915 RepID=UPI0028773CF2|nr:hypothetical protein [Herbiconiux oxytropis]